ncbi:hypothetical protein [Hymenobacter lapidiphilus]|uniref:Immunity protein 8 n=1 Tax=Hymenobacter lapidiphilus TaxID=2608003 RepID=A0A7Y7U5J4_9BACT|nr:hypothetical protein [Hymenobacter lapidiphilus]NVO30824.1 hypothetical protein [Hymenobacter lapidiphilus]
MSEYTLYSWGASEVPDLSDYNPVGDFCIEVQFDLKYAEEDGLITYWFILANNNGLFHYIENNLHEDEMFLSVKKIIITKEFSYENLMLFLNNEVRDKCIVLNNFDLCRYLNSEFNESID